jgi:eukaryotic-like serine/threonine-protein kinase
LIQKRSASVPVITTAPIRLTYDSGLTKDPSISGDGKLVTYSSDRAGSFDIYLQQIGGGPPIRVAGSPYDEEEPSFSPDGTQIVYRSNENGGGVYVIPTFGGDARRIAKRGFGPKFSPDGRQIAYWTGSDPVVINPDCRVEVVPSNGGTPRRIRTDFVGVAAPLWTPDGSHLLVFGLKDTHSWWEWWTTDLQGSEPVRAGINEAIHPVTPNPTGVGASTWWKGDLLCSVATSETTSLWSIPFSSEKWTVSGAPHRLSSGTGNESQLSVSESGRAVFTSTATNVDIYALPIDSNRGKVTGELERLTHDVSTEDFATLSADGHLMAFQSNRSGRVQVWSKDMRTGKEIPLAEIAGPASLTSLISPDGSRIAFSSSDGENRNLLLVGTQGGEAQIYNDDAQVFTWSPDSRSLLIVPGHGLAVVRLRDLDSRRLTNISRPLWQAEEKAHDLATAQSLHCLWLRQSRPQRIL